jgi:hypothetical protein
MLEHSFAEWNAGSADQGREGVLIHHALVLVPPLQKFHAAVHGSNDGDTIAPHSSLSRDEGTRKFISRACADDCDDRVAHRGESPWPRARGSYAPNDGIGPLRFPRERQESVSRLGGQRCECRVLGRLHRRLALAEALNDLAQQLQRGAVELLCEHPRVPGRVHGKNRLAKHRARVVLVRETVCSHSGHGVARFDSPEIRVGTTMPREQRRVHAYGAERRELEDVRGDARGPEPADDEIDARRLYAAKELRAAHVGLVEQTVPTEPMQETTRPNAPATERRKCDVDPIGVEQERGERQAKEGDTQAGYFSFSRLEACMLVASSPSWRRSAVVIACSTSVQSCPRSVERPRKPMGIRNPPLSRRPPP